MKVGKSFLISLILFTQGNAVLTDFRNYDKNYSELDYLIDAEVKNDEFYEAIYQISAVEPIDTILEIGSSNGEGSTRAFVEGIKNNPRHPKLFCMEISEVRFKTLQDHYKDETQVYCYHASSVPLSKFPGKRKIKDFYRRVDSLLRDLELEEVLYWLKQDKMYLHKHKVAENGIELIKKENGIKYFGIVLIDGSEFLGKPELQEVYGAQIIMLDDILTYKNYENYHQLIKDPNYELLIENKTLRHGFAIFKKKLSD